MIFNNKKTLKSYCIPTKIHLETPFLLQAIENASSLFIRFCNRHVDSQDIHGLHCT